MCLQMSEAFNSFLMKLNCSQPGNLQLESNVIIWEQIVFANVRKNYATYVLAARQVANIQTKNVKIEKLNLPPK